MRAIKIYRSGIHLGEEKIIDGNQKSGMVTFSGCHLNCNFCYTPETSVHEWGNSYSSEDFYNLLEDLVTRGARNLNFITPTHLWGVIQEPLLRIKFKYGSLLPIILKVSGYEGQGIVRSFSKVADIMVPDFKVWGAVAAKQVGLPENYGNAAQLAISQMLQTHGRYLMTDEGKLSHGILVRHLLMPDFFEDSMEVIRALSEIKYRGYLNLMTYFIDPKTRQVMNANPKALSLIVQSAIMAGMRVLVNGRERNNQRIQKRGTYYAQAE